MLTGASRGLGAAMALEFARRGARLALLARDHTRLDEVAAQARNLGAETMVLTVDVRDTQALGNVVQRVVDQWGRLDVLANVAALTVECSVEDADRDTVRAILETNYLAPLALCQAALPQMRRQNFGRIINVSSILGKRATPFMGPYAASKAALNAITDALRVEISGSGIRVTLVCPGRLRGEGGSSSRLLTMSTEKAARRIVDCVERPRPELILTLAAKVLGWMSAVAPRSVDRIVWHMHGGTKLAPRRPRGGRDTTSGSGDA